jgi:hypothetical protein
MVEVHNLSKIPDESGMPVTVDDYQKVGGVHTKSSTTIPYNSTRAITVKDLCINMHDTPATPQNPEVHAMQACAYGGIGPMPPSLRVSIADPGAPGTWYYNAAP